MEVPARGTVRLYTVAKLDTFGEKLKEPKLIALIDIEKTDSAMIGIIKTRNLDRDFAGMKVKAILRPKNKREGTLKDILYFE
jgi:uncharacterized OB-fold protein